MIAVTALEHLGNLFINQLRETGLMLEFLYQTTRRCFQRPWRLHLIVEHMESIGVRSLFIILLTGSFTGAVFSLQLMAEFRRFGMDSMVGSTVLLAISRELGPVMTALMTTGRVASAMATELGTMRVTEQIDAMEVMAVDPVKYLASPRIIAGSIMLPALTMLFFMVAAMGSYLISVTYFGVDEGAFMDRIRWMLDPYDLWQGLCKSFFFGVLLTLVGCYKGFHAKGGARGVGLATTQAVVTASVAIFALDYILTSILLIWEPQ